ncbi:radical SAM/SPASM domain-containing protein [Sandaracinus amylolyticus]|uniref:radical SAM/SPASM domain-containing protein n=1 Tax=Sandaracinus amylolyticus TaxID=927083 RepID=UPI001F011B5E|nr:radical SAM protein [Sandaracinus amylolyticus]
MSVGSRTERRELVSAEERDALLRAPRPKSLPLAPMAEPARRRLPLADDARAIDRRVRPIYAVWEITLACDLACRHCGSRAGRDRPDELSTEQCLDLVDQMADLGVKEVSLIGGEAYLRDDWTDIIRRIRARGMMAILTTGGRGITPERARDAAAAGLQSASVSIDGDEATHDRLRGVAGSYRAALDAMKNLRAAGVQVSANTQINRLSAPELPSVLETIADHGAHSWQIQLTVAMGRAADEPEVLLQPYDLLEVFPMLARLAERCRERGVRLWPGNNVGYFGPHEHVLRGSLPKGHMYSCGAGRSTLGIEADGSIKGCPSLPTLAWTGGNIRDAKLVDIWERGGSAMRYTRDRTVEDLWGYCRTCYYADECRAGCTWTGFVLFGRPGNNPYCHHRALEMQRAGKRERVVKVESAPGQPFDHARFELIVEDEESRDADTV